MTYLINGLNTRAGLRGGGPVGTYHLSGLGSARSDYDFKADTMRKAAEKSPFPIPTNVTEASIVAALGPRPAKDKAAPLTARQQATLDAKARSAAATAACKAAGGVFDAGAPNGCRMPGDIAFGSASTGSGDKTLLYVGVAAGLLGLLALSRR